MKVSDRNQNKDDKFNNSRRYLVQLSLSETQVHIWLHENKALPCNFSQELLSTLHWTDNSQYRLLN